MEKHLKYIWLVVGKSGSGKTTLVNKLESVAGLKPVQSYTTRKPRFDGETGHIFIEEGDSVFIKEFPKRVAYTMFDDNHYFVTEDQLRECDTYVIDPKGIADLLNYDIDGVQFLIVYVDCPAIVCFWRMLKRGDGFIKSFKRVLHDRHQGFHITKKYAHVVVKNWWNGGASRDESRN